MTKREMNAGDPRHEKQDYEVGYGKPPKATRFQRGRSGHKGPRRKRSTSLGMDIKKGLHRKVTVRNGDNGEATKMTEREFAVASLVQHAMKGNMPAIKLVLQLDREAESVERAAAREFEEWPRLPKFEWTEEQERLFKEMEEAAARIRARENDADEE